MQTGAKAIKKCDGKDSAQCGSARILTLAFLSLLAMGALVASCGTIRDIEGKNKSKETARAEVTSMEREALGHLYKMHPDAKPAIEKSAGYAVFDELGTHIFFVSAAHGKGVAVNNRTGKETFMKVLSAGAGPGLGVKDYRVIFVFETEKAYRDFVDGNFKVSAQADAAAKAGHEGGAFSGAFAVAPGVWLYQITETGLALQATLQGTKYYRDSGLN